MKAKDVIALVGKFTSSIRVVSERRVFADVERERLLDVLQVLKDSGVQHLSTISGVDRGSHISVLYHLDCRPCLLSLRVNLPAENPEVRTVSDILPGAELYERDLMEMLGVRVTGHPDPRRFFLPDDWPEGQYPLRKEARAK
jgi:Ni,Fe-hydrogenase III component G